MITLLAEVNTGAEWLVDARGCDAESLRCEEPLRALMADMVAKLALHVIGVPQWHTFGGEGGVTALYMLSESHLTLHTFPEHGYFALNLYHCGDRGAQLRPDWPALLGGYVTPEDIRVQCITRAP